MFYYLTKSLASSALPSIGLFFLDFSGEILQNQKKDSFAGIITGDKDKRMASLKFPLEILAVFVIISVILLPIAQSHSSSPAPAPTSDGTSIDQGIAYVLMMVALALTYFIH
ncbi:putative arabinogalactan protein/22/41 [Arabidopsis thaliana]